MKQPNIQRSGRRIVAASAAAFAATLAMAASPSVQAEDADVAALRQQLQALQQQIDAIEARRNGTPMPAAAAPAAAVAVAPAAAPAASTSPSFNAGPIKVTLGGFVEMMVVNRSKNEAADWASNWNSAIPFPQSQNAGLSEFHLTERQSRVSALAQAPTDPNVAAEAYLEADFGGGPRTGNNNESTSFSPRVRHFYADYQRKDQGWYLLFGQSWSLMTQNKKGIVPRQELIPLTIDGQYVPGFTWDRTPQIRLVKNFGTVAALGISFENPAALYGGVGSCGTISAGVAATAPVCNTAGGSGFDANNSITLDGQPDIIVKAAFDPGWGHYEVFGIDRSFRDRVNGSNNSTSAVSVGGSVLLPLVANRLDFMASGLAGKGVGRYGSAQLPDMTLKPDGTLEALQGYEFLAGLTFKATSDLTVYAYGGREHVDDSNLGVTVVAGKNVLWGYGNPLSSNANCLIEGSSGSCTANTSSVTQGTIGGWWKFYKGALGNMQVGVQLTNVKRETYAGVGGAPSTSMNVGEISFRYYPYQN